MQNSLTLVIFGATGDLAKRYLMPAVEEMGLKGMLPPEFQFIAASRANYETLNARLSNREANKIFHLAVPPHACEDTIEFILKEDLARGDTKILLEKPFGTDLESAKHLINVLGKHFQEDKIYRVDHYLARQTAQDILLQRQEDADLESRLNNAFVESIDIVASEKIDIEGRVNFYEHTGALRDWVQSHLLELSSLILMELPSNNEKNISHLRYDALKDLTIVCDVTSSECVKRGQYQGYLEEVKNPKSMVETFVSVRLASNNPRWRGVRITLAHGKALKEKYTRVLVRFKNGQQTVFDLSHQKDDTPVNGYIAVYQHALLGDHELFVSSGEVLESWRILDAVQKSWARADTNNAHDLIVYKKGASLEDIL